MSKENMELYRRGIEAFNRRDLEGFLALADPDVVGISRVLESGSYRGHDGTREWWKDLLDVFPDFRIEVVWVRDAGNMTVSELRNSGHHEGSAAPLEESVMDGSFGGRCMKASKTPSKPPAFRSSRFGRKAATSNRTDPAPRRRPGGRAGLAGAGSGAELRGFFAF